MTGTWRKAAAIVRGGSLRAAAGVRDRAFTPVLRFEPEAPAILLSPHFDDATLNCWSLLTGPAPQRVVNVFAGTPASRTPGEWDRLCGAKDAHEQMTARTAEDAAALAVTGNEPVNLSLCDHQYRGPLERPSLKVLDAELSKAIPSAGRLIAPMGVLHPDHELVQRYALEVRATGMPLTFYAEVPHGVPCGWPAWVTGASGSGPLDTEWLWQQPLARMGSALSEPTVVRLRDEEATRKLEVLRMYKTQFTALDGGPLGLVSNPLIHPYEVFWELG